MTEQHTSAILTLETELNKPLALQTLQKDGFDYIPWHASVTRMNEIFGPLGWSDEVIREWSDEYAFYCQVRVTVYLPDGTTRHHDGVGSDEKHYTDEREVISGGKVATPSPAKIGRMWGMKAKAAYSDALSRAFKRWSTLGLGLYNGEESTFTDDTPASPKASNYTPAKTTTPAKSSPTTDDPASEAQIGLMKRIGFDYIPDNLSKRQAMALIKSVKEEKKSVKEAFKLAKIALPEAETDSPAPDTNDFPF